MEPFFVMDYRAFLPALARTTFTHMHCSTEWGAPRSKSSKDAAAMNLTKPYLITTAKFINITILRRVQNKLSLFSFYYQ